LTASSLGTIFSPEVVDLKMLVPVSGYWGENNRSALNTIAENSEKGAKEGGGGGWR